MSFVRLDRINATAHIESIVSAGDLLNGQFVALGALQADGEARLATPAGAGDIVFHASVPLQYESLAEEKDFKLTAGKVGRGIVLTKGDIVSVLNTGALAEGDAVMSTENGFAVAVDPVAEGSVTGSVIALETMGNVGELAVIRIG